MELPVLVTGLRAEGVMGIVGRYLPRVENGNFVAYDTDALRAYGMYEGPQRPMRDLRHEEPEPVCGKDFCEQCGDCLACYGSDPCVHTEDGRHVWVVVS